MCTYFLIIVWCVGMTDCHNCDTADYKYTENGQTGYARCANCGDYLCQTHWDEAKLIYPYEYKEDLAGWSVYRWLIEGCTKCNGIPPPPAPPGSPFSLLMLHIQASQHSGIGSS